MTFGIMCFLYLVLVRAMQFLTYCVNQNLDSVKQKKSATCIADIAQTSFIGWNKVHKCFDIRLCSCKAKDDNVIDFTEN